MHVIQYDPYCPFYFLIAIFRRNSYHAPEGATAPTVHSVDAAAAAVAAVLRMQASGSSSVYAPVSTSSNMSTGAAGAPILSAEKQKLLLLRAGNTVSSNNWIDEDDSIQHTTQPHAHRPAVRLPSRSVGSTYRAGAKFEFQRSPIHQSRPAAESSQSPMEKVPLMQPNMIPTPLFLPPAQQLIDEPRAEDDRARRIDEPRAEDDRAHRIDEPFAEDDRAHHIGEPRAEDDRVGPPPDEPHPDDASNAASDSSSADDEADDAKKLYCLCTVRVF
jgi:hypothetical protein